jgi:hypothetical protein
LTFLSRSDDAGGPVDVAAVQPADDRVTAAAVIVLARWRTGATEEGVPASNQRR